MSIRDWPGLDDGWPAHGPVGHSRPNPFGLHEVHGNVWEWCRDWYKSYKVPVTPGEGLRDELVGTPRVLRGGGYKVPAEFARSSTRDASLPDVREANAGVRPARPIE